MESPPEVPDQQRSTDIAHARVVGSRLRAVRHQMDLSLQDVEDMSKRVIRASVLGSYERGDRAINVPRLQRLAKFYDVPIDQLLPDDDEASPRRSDAQDTGHPPGPSHTARVGQQKMPIDLTRLRAGAGPDHFVLQRFVGMIQVRRQDFNERVITLRSTDLRAIACFLGGTVEALGRRLEDLGLSVVT
jgi:transcriptional regulator with XRE-family HTH domain